MEKLARNFNLMGLSVSRTTREIEIDEMILKKISGLEYESFQPLHFHSLAFHDVPSWGRNKGRREPISLFEGEGDRNELRFPLLPDSIEYSCGDVAPVGGGKRENKAARRRNTVRSGKFYRWASVQLS